MDRLCGLPLDQAAEHGDRVKEPGDVKWRDTGPRAAVPETGYPCLVMLTPLTGADRGSLGQTLPFRTRLLRTRADAVRLGRRLNQLTISWNLMEGAVAVVAGW